MGALKHGRRIPLIAVLAIAALIVSAFVLVSRLATSDRALAPGSPAADPYPGWQTFESARETVPVVGLRYPPTWRVETLGRAHEPKRYEVLPPGLPGTETGRPTFAVSLTQVHEDPGPGHPDFRRSGTRPDGRPFVRSESQREDGEREVIYRISWGPRCAYANPQCPIASGVLVVRIVSSDSSLWDRFGTRGEQLVRSIQDLYLSDWPSFASKADDHFRMKYPPGWIVERVDKGDRTTYELRPPGLPSTTTGRPTVAVTITYIRERYDPAHPELQRPKANTRADGRPYLGSWSFPPGRQETTLRISWMPACAYQDPLCEVEPATLVVRFFASDKKLQNQYSSDYDESDNWLLESPEYM